MTILYCVAPDRKQILAWLPIPSGGLARVVTSKAVDDLEFPHGRGGKTGGARRAGKAPDFEWLEARTVLRMWRSRRGTNDGFVGSDPSTEGLEAGRSCLLVGGNGSGKTRLAKIVVGLPLLGAGVG